MQPGDADPVALEYLRRVPKVELHVHLEGGVRAPRLFEILRRNRLHPEVRGPEDLAPLYRHAHFGEFLDHFRFAVLCLRDVQDVHDVAFDLCSELAAQNVVEAEILFSAPIFTRLGMPLGELLAAVTEAADRVPPAAGGRRRRYDFVIDLVRNFGPEAAHDLALELGRLGHPRVVGVHLGGDEVGFPAERFATAFAAARDAGLGLAAHAGEAAGADSVRAAVRVLGVQRVGHGIRCLEDDDLVDELARRGVTLEVCPTSNVCTGVVASLEAHPLPELVRRGLAVTLGSDDPAFFDTDLGRELQVAHTRLGLDLEALDGLMDAGLRATFRPAAERQAGLAALGAERAALRRQLGLPVRDASH